ncbi:hypothetical protein MIND_01205900 [Mycena indigotica]|uniref:Uncharacterized protein n=1 Tax=Mycena indigotica TaxID=2126181 RepID=A0A8H6S863_9AGAR|nr:uncharacterized protein MIND_01205900 [Mycena indigotica]KAF7293065.1 hypothetical protein MIND_01205900 [Mycena indigotica]
MPALPFSSSLLVQAPVAISSDIGDRCHDIDGCRTVIQILLSCISTVILSTYSSVHPNVPPTRRDQREKSFWKEHRQWSKQNFANFKPKFVMFLVALVAPELIFGLAYRQYASVKQLMKDFKLKKSHAWLLVMGGFATSEGHPLFRQSDVMAYREAMERQTPVEIKDKSKADLLSKLLALAQLLWFVLQIMMRVATGLPLSELEIATVAFAFIPLCTWWFWKDKPKDVGEAIRLDIEPGKELGLKQLGNQVVRTSSQSPLVVEVKAELDASDSDSDTVVSTSDAMSGEPDDPPRSVPGYKMEEPGNGLQHQTSLCRSGTDTTLVESEVGNDGCETRHTEKPKSEYGLLAHQSWSQQLGVLLTATIFGTYPKTPEMKQRTAVPIFWPGPWPKNKSGVSATPLQALALQFLISLLFGAIHLLAWDLHFPSVIELWMWRASATAIIIIPLFGLILAMASSGLKNGALRTAVMSTNHVLAVVYILARMTLLALPFTTLRNLPSGVYVDFSWSSFIPHI